MESFSACTGVSVEEMEGTTAPKRRLPVSSVQDSKRRKVINDTGKQKLFKSKVNL